MVKENYLDVRGKTEYTKLKTAGNILKEGGLVLFPTETVYGLGANGLDEKAVRSIFTAKGRSQDNPLILHISDMAMLDIIAQNISEIEYRLMNAFWPGPFTIILNRTKIVPDRVTGGLDTVGIRMPSGKIARELIRYAGVPIAAPSANISGKPSGTNVEDIFEELSDKVDYIINGGECEIGVESTVVRMEGDRLHILRPGKITKEELSKVVEKVIVDPHILNRLEDEKEVRSPGMKYRHYAPEANCVLVYSKDNGTLVEKIKEIVEKYKNPLIISTHENSKQYQGKKVIDIGQKEDLNEIARNIFTSLRKVDSYHPDIVVIEGVTKEGVGLAIMNRLIRACEYNYIEC